MSLHGGGDHLDTDETPGRCASDSIKLYVTVQIPLELLRHLPMRIATRWGRCPPATTFSHGQRSECADLSEPMSFR